MKVFSLASTRAPGSALMARFGELVLVIAICALAAYWAMLLLAGTPLQTAPAAQADNPGAAPPSAETLMESTRLFGARAPGTLSDNIAATGIIADGAGRGRVLISIDGQPPQSYQVGDSVDGRRLTAIRSREIELENAGARRVYRMNMPEVPSDGIVPQ